MLTAAFYRGTRPGVPGIYNRLVRRWERGDYSHCELIFSDGMSGSASFMDHGVRLKQIDYDSSRWDFLVLPDELETDARAWFEAHKGEPYDLMGNVHLVIGFFPHDSDHSFCSEALAESLGIMEAFRLGPNALYSVLLWRYPQA